MAPTDNHLARDDLAANFADALAVRLRVEPEITIIAVTQAPDATPGSRRGSDHE
jgi:hypothetical protein